MKHESRSHHAFQNVTSNYLKLTTTTDVGIEGTWLKAQSVRPRYFRDGYTEWCRSQLHASVPQTARPEWVMEIN